MSPSVIVISSFLIPFLPLCFSQFSSFSVPGAPQQFASRTPWKMEPQQPPWGYPVPNSWTRPSGVNSWGKPYQTLPEPQPQPSSSLWPEPRPQNSHSSSEPRPLHSSFEPPQTSFWPHPQNPSRSQPSQASSDSPTPHSFSYPQQSQNPSWPQPSSEPRPSQNPSWSQPSQTTVEPQPSQASSERQPSPNPSWPPPSQTSSEPPLLEASSWLQPQPSQSPPWTQPPQNPSWPQPSWTQSSESPFWPQPSQNPSWPQPSHTPSWSQPSSPSWPQAAWAQPPQSPSWPQAAWAQPPQSPSSPHPEIPSFSQPRPSVIQPPKTPFRPPLPNITSAEPDFSSTPRPMNYLDMFPSLPNKEPFLPHLALPSPDPTPKEDCVSEEGELGTCMSALECGASNGEMSGSCHQGLDNSLYHRVCCTYPAGCGFRTNQDVTYFRSPGYPNATSDHKDCVLKVDLQPGVCQVRLDFLDFKLGGMQSGTCDPDNQMILSSTVPHAFLPAKSVCGTLSPRTLVDPTNTDMPNLYLHLDDMTETKPGLARPNTPGRSVTLRVKVTDSSSRWNVRATQVTCDGSSLQAPPGCAHYYLEREGRLTSLNFAGGSYGRNLSLTSCLKPDYKACAIRYDMEYMGVGKTRGNRLSYGLACGDYITFTGERTGLCGTVQGRQMVLPNTGLQGLTLDTDDTYKGKEEVGYDIKYRFLHDCSALQFFQYPTPGQKPQVNIQG